MTEQKERIQENNNKEEILENNDQNMNIDSNDEILSKAKESDNTSKAIVEEFEKLNNEMNMLKELVSKKDIELAELKDLMMRRQADFENYKKRNIQNEELNRKMLVRDLATDFLSINDNLIRACEASSHVKEGESLEEAHRSYVDGVMMISKQIEKLLEKYGIEEIKSENFPFNPEVHEAIEIDYSENVNEDTVTKVYQKGYKIDKFVLRNAKVKVSKPKPKTENNGK